MYYHTESRTMVNGNSVIIVFFLQILFENAQFSQYCGDFEALCEI